MGHKTHPYGFRLGIIKDWKAHWYAPNSSSYRHLVTQDLRLRESIKTEYKAFSDAGIAKETCSATQRFRPKLPPWSPISRRTS